MSKPFYINPNTNFQLTYPQLVEELQYAIVYTPYCHAKETIEIFRQLVKSLIADSEITLLDPDFSPDELSAIGITTAQLQLRSTINSEPAMTNSDQLVSIIQQAANWKINLFTSGTTGTPKKIVHSLDSLTRAVKITPEKSNDVWALAYNPTHIAGLQVFFQALFNGNTIVDLYKQDKQSILSALKKYRVTNLSATPTFYRLLLPLNDTFPDITRITSGGERFDPDTMAQLRTAFPNAKFTNIYASTEAGTLLSSHNDLFEIKTEYKSLLKIHDGELWAHSSLTRVTEDAGEWYATGDMVEIVEQQPLRFRFIHRKDDLLKIGGYKVDPNEVEQVLKEHPAVANGRVYGQPNRITGTILLADVIVSDPDLTERQLIEFLRGKLQPFKIPRIINFVDSLPLTRSGKIKRT